MTLDDDEVVRGQIFIVSSHEIRFFPIETLSFDSKNDCLRGQMLLVIVLRFFTWNEI